MKVYENGVFKDADIEYIDITSKPDHEVFTWNLPRLD